VAATRFSRARLGITQSGFFVGESEVRSELRNVSNHLRKLLKFPDPYTPSRMQSLHRLAGLACSGQQAAGAKRHQRGEYLSRYDALAADERQRSANPLQDVERR